jgi:hypothetical protein
LKLQHDDPLSNFIVKLNLRRYIVGKKAAGGKLKPLFVQCILDPIWKLYHAAEAEKHGYAPEVRRCRLSLSKSASKAPMASALEATI